MSQDTSHGDRTETQRITDLIALLDGARLSADAATDGDHLSPWATVAAEVHLAGAHLASSLTTESYWPPEPRMVGCCTSNLQQASLELDQLHADGLLHSEIYVPARCWITTALTHARQLDP